MKTLQFQNLAVVSLLAAMTLNAQADDKDSCPVSAENCQNAVIENIMTRTSIRDFKDTPIEDSKIETLLRAAMAAPTAGNKQPWRFIVINDRYTLNAISDNFHSMSMAKKAPLAIVVCGDLNATFPGDGADYWIQDASAATENLLLAAHSMGLGAVWCGIYPQMQRVEKLKEMLVLPDDIVPLNVIPIGYPAQDPKPKDKWKPGNVHFESWSGDTLQTM